MHLLSKLGSLSALVLLPTISVASTLVDALPAVTAAQVDFRKGKDSANLYVSVGIPTLRTLTGPKGGFINVADGDGRWIVRNMPVPDAQDGEYSARATYAGLQTPHGVPVDSIGLNAAFSATPLQSFAPDSTATPVAVGTHELYDGSVIGPGMAPLEGGYRDTPPPPPPPPPGWTLDDYFEQPGYEPVETAENQCAPAAFATVLDFLSRSTEYALPFEHKPGVGLDDEGHYDSLVGAFDIYMRRGEGAGTDTDQMIQGLDRLFANNGAACGDGCTLRISHYGLGGDDDIRRGGKDDNPVISTGGGVDIDFGDLRDLLRDGAAVIGTFDVFENTPTGDTVQGSHTMNIVGAGVFSGSGALGLMHDPTQETPNSDTGTVTHVMGTGKFGEIGGTKVPQVSGFPALVEGNTNTGAFLSRVTVVKCDCPPVPLPPSGLMALAGLAPFFVFAMSRRRA